MKYKTWEVVKMLTENPELVFVRPSDGVRTMLGDKIHAGEIIGKYLKQTNGEIIRLSDEWELVPLSVPFMEAVNSRKKFKYFDWDNYYSPSAVMCILAAYTNDTVLKLINDNQWLIEA